MEKCIYKEYDICAVKHCCEKKKPLSSDAVLGEGWRDARKELPNKDGFYLCYLHGEGVAHYRVVDWRNNGWTDTLFAMRNYLKAWCPLPDPPAFD
jgi:hypothetical protein